MNAPPDQPRDCSRSQPIATKPGIPWPFAPFESAARHSMKTGRKLLLPLAIGFLALTRPLVAEEWRLVYSVTEVKEINDPRGQTPPRHDTRSYPLNVVLGRDYLVVQDDRQERIYDFQHLRQIVMPLDTKAYADWSLYSNLDFRVNELMNRAAMAAGMRAAKLPIPRGCQRFDAETGLRLEVPGFTWAEPEAVIEPVQLMGDAREFRHDQQTALRFSPDATPIPKPFFRRYASFLTYECWIHPKIRRLACGPEKVAKELVVSWLDAAGVATATYELRSVMQVPTDSRILPADAHPANDAADRLAGVMADVQAEGHGSRRLTRDDETKFIRDAMTDRRPLDAFLAIVEWGNQTGEQLNDEIERDQAEFQRDAQCRQYFSCLNQSNPEACRRSLAACESIDRRRLQKAYMIDLQRADLLQKLAFSNRGGMSNTQVEQARSAEKLFLQVLAANPFVAGVYHDLGVLYCSEYNQGLGWRCFDTGRRLYPQHPQFQEVNALEQRLRHDFPDYF